MRSQNDPHPTYLRGRKFMIFTVTKWCPQSDYHECMDIHGNKHRFDLMVSACVDLKAEDYVGKTFEGPDSAIRPYISIFNEFWEK